jgi:peptide/nickel transport system permease protein
MDSEAAVPSLENPRRSRSLLSRDRLWRKNPSMFWGALIVLFTVLVALFSRQLAPYDPIAQDLNNVLQPPSWQHLCGTDNYGRDVFSRIICATPLDLSVGVLSVILPFIIGVVVGIISGFYGGSLDTLIMRLVDVVIAFPFLVLIITIVAVLGPGLQNAVIAITVASWIIYARMVRAECLVHKNLEYVTAAKVLAFGDLRIMVRHVLPNVITPAIVFAAVDVILNIGVASSLGFLGLGAQPPTPEWGALIAEGRGFMSTAWWISTFPGIAIVIVGVGFTLLADGLADFLRPGREV